MAERKRIETGERVEGFQVLDHIQERARFVANRGFTPTSVVLSFSQYLALMDYLSRTLGYRANTLITSHGTIRLVCVIGHNAAPEVVPDATDMPSYYVNLETNT